MRARALRRRYGRAKISPEQRQIELLLEAAVIAGDAGIAEHCRRALNAALAVSEPWAVKAATQKCVGFVAYAQRHNGVTVNEWTLPAELLS